MKGVFVAAGLALALQAGLVAAQPSTSTPSDVAGRQFEAGRTADFNNWLWRARQGVVLSEAERAVQVVVDAVTRKDCAAAVAGLNAGLAKGHADVMLLAAAMFEDGTCVKPNWDRAVSLYQRAFAAGQGAAGARLSAAYAAAGAANDPAASLWWALRAQTPLPAECSSLAPLVDEAERFVTALKAWPRDQLGHCVQVGAVMSQIRADVDAPSLAASYGLSGTVRVNFVPGKGQLEFVQDLADDLPATGQLGDPLDVERRMRTARKSFDAHLQAVGQRALARFPPPPSLPAAWRVQAVYVYKPTPK